MIQKNIIYSFAFVIISISFVLGSCKNPKEPQNKTGRREHSEDVNVVVTSKATNKIFYKEFENNGTLLAQERAQLPFEETGKIIDINAFNGKTVHKGDIIARIEDSEQLFAYEKACRTVDQKRLSFEEELINQRYTLNDSAKIPHNILQIALIRSGYQDAINDKTLAGHHLKATKVIAPFDGVVADLEAKTNNETSSYEFCCTLINNKTFEVTFPMLESEISDIQAGMKAEIIPFAYSGDTITGKIAEINPKVEETGMINVKALVNNQDGKLLDGMNVKIMVKKNMGLNLCIPKEAVTLRQEKNVVFVAWNDTAYWHYVDIGETNSAFTVIKKGIKEGENVVIEGNFNLSHLAPIEVIKQL